MFNDLPTSTEAIRSFADGQKKNRPLSTPIYRGAVFAAEDTRQHAELFMGGKAEFYQRFGHPNERELCQLMARLECTEASLAFASGMSAISTVLLAMTPANGRLVVPKRMFDQTEKLLSFIASRMQADIIHVDSTDLDAVEQAVSSDIDLMYIETPTNPGIEISDIAGIANITKKFGIPLLVDSTFAPPVIQKPATLGASLVLHSGTKFLNGHMDAMCGFVSGEQKLIDKIASFQQLLGGIIDPQAVWLVQRGIKTLGVRMDKIAESAHAIAHFLAAHNEVFRVYFPFLEQSHNHTVARHQMKNGGGVLSFTLHKGGEAAHRLLNGLEFIHIASSLGGVETTIELPYDLDWAVGVNTRNNSINAPIEGLIRLSVGLEDVEVLLADFEQALSKL